MTSCGYGPFSSHSISIKGAPISQAACPNSAIREYSERIDWENMTIIARSGPACIDAVVILASLPPTRTTAKLSLACPLSGNQAQVVRELLDLAIDVATLRFRKLIGGRELANSELLASLRENQTAGSTASMSRSISMSQWKMSAG